MCSGVKQRIDFSSSFLDQSELEHRFNLLTLLLCWMSVIYGPVILFPCSMKHEFTNYSKKSSRMSFNEQLFLTYFLNIAFVRDISPT